MPRETASSRIFLVVALVLLGSASAQEAATPTADFGGIGKIKIGMTRGQIEKASERAFPKSPHTSDPVVSPDCYFARPAGWSEDIGMMMVRGKLVRIDVTGGQTATRNGVRIGASESDVYAAYGERSTVWSAHHFYTDGKYLLVHSPDGRQAALFETDGSLVTQYRVGNVDAVQWVEGCE